MLPPALNDEKIADGIDRQTCMPESVRCVATVNGYVDSIGMVWYGIVWYMQVKFMVYIVRGTARRKEKEVCR